MNILEKWLCLKRPDRPLDKYKQFKVELCGLRCGNHLMVADSIYDELREMALSRYKYFGIGELYQHWIGVVQEILHSRT